MDSNAPRHGKNVPGNLAASMRQAMYGIAVGDALGLGIEDKKSPEIAVLFPQGVDRYRDSKWSHAGDVSDDTGMSACILAAIMQVEKRMPADILRTSQAYGEQLNQAIYQSFLYWGETQEFDGQQLAKDTATFRDRSYVWPPELEVFCTTPGAGISTLKVLVHHRAMGTPDQPADTGETYGYSDGCGGLMRVVPIAIWSAYHGLDAFEMGLRSAAITHGDPQAYITSGLLSDIIARRVAGAPAVSFAQATEEALTAFKARTDIPETNKKLCEAAIQQANDFAQKPLVPGGEAMDRLAQNYIDSQHVRGSFYTANIVFLHSLAALFAAENHALGLKETLQLAVTHSGDSDSVGAIVGGAMGATKSVETLLKPEIEALDPRYREGLNALTQAFTKSVTPQPNKASKWERF